MASAHGTVAIAVHAGSASGPASVEASPVAATVAVAGAAAFAQGRPNMDGAGVRASAGLDTTSARGSGASADVPTANSSSAGFIAQLGDRVLRSELSFFSCQLSPVSTMDSHPSPLAQVVQTHKVDKPTVRVYYTETMTGVDVAPLHSLIMGLALVCAGLLSCSSSFWRACSCSLRCLFAPLGLELRPYNLDRPRVHPRRANPESP